MAEAIATRRIPGKPTTIQTVPKTRGVVSKWVEPAAWSDGSNDDFTEDAVQRYDVELWRAGAKVDDARVKGNRKFWPMTKAEAQLTGYSTKVWSVGVDGDAVDADAPAGSATPEDITLGNIDGTVTKPQMGTLGISRFGSTSTMNAAAAVDGDIWINTSFSPTRVYRRVSGAWVYEIKGDVLQAGTVIADAVVAGAIDGHTITGAIIQTATSGERIVINSISFPGAVQFISPSGAVRYIAADGSDLRFQDGAGGVDFVIGPSGIATIGLPIKLGPAADDQDNFLEIRRAGATPAGPATPPANSIRLYVNTNAGLTRLLCKMPDGTTKVVATE